MLICKYLVKCFPVGGKVLLSNLNNNANIFLGLVHTNVTKRVRTQSSQVREFLKIKKQRVLDRSSLYLQRDFFFQRITGTDKIVKNGAPLVKEGPGRTV